MNKAPIKALAVLCNVGLCNGFIPFDFLEGIGTVDLPAFQEADVNGIDRAIKGTPHTHIAMMMKSNLPLGFIDIVIGTISNTFSAMGTRFFFHTIEKRFFGWQQKRMPDCKGGCFEFVQFDRALSYTS